MYSCNVCNYNTDFKTNYNRHCRSKKHMNKHNYTCDICKKQYKHHSGLIRHKHIHSKQEIKPSQTNVIYNNTFNIFNFLNTNYPSACNLSEFIQNIDISFEDLEIIKYEGYIKSIRNTLVQALKNIDKDKRPIHCTDIKRKQFYVRDNDMWHKDSNTQRIQKAVNQYNNNQLLFMVQWKSEQTDWKYNEDKQNTSNKITYEITQMYSEGGNKIKNRILNEISNATFNDKK